MQLTRWLKNVNIVDGKKVCDRNTNTNTVHYCVKYQIYLKVTCIDVAVMFQQMHPGGKIKRNEVRFSKNLFGHLSFQEREREGSPKNIFGDLSFFSRSS